ncbi:hypothetical protein TI39_contig803g00001 [Zymoseptoria brevis]|uniref:Rhodopsin domain-containing protein n=1 Tax=Zymoseptoria brevis TaxID=1047168 RepID=A0A0F4GFF5_9PEZI|nr:hypothetical protein TI39_contig803g00001 [Zymoseptoria brevis]
MVGPSENAGPLLMGLSWTEATIATVVIGLRAYCALRVVRQAEWDLIWALTAWLCNFTSQTILTMSVAAYGYGKHLADISASDHIEASRLVWLGQISGAIGAVLARTAIVALMLRVQGEILPRTKWLLHAVCFVNIALGAIQTAMIVKICPVDTPIAGGCDYGLIPSAVIIGYTQAGWAIGSDLFLATYAVVVFRKMRISARRKLSMSFMMGGGYLAAIAATMRMIYLRRLQVSDDPFFNGYPLILWTYTEEWLILILGSLPRLFSFYLILRLKVRSRQGSSGSNLIRSRPNREDLEKQDKQEKTETGEYKVSWPDHVTVNDVGLLPPCVSTVRSVQSCPQQIVVGPAVNSTPFAGVGILPSVYDSDDNEQVMSEEHTENDRQQTARSFEPI